MRSAIYRSFEDLDAEGLNYNSRYSDERPLVVNCAGLINLSRKFETYNRRGRADYYLMYIVNGSLKVYLGDGVQVAEPGDFVIFPPEYKYRYSFSGKGELSYYFVHYTGSEADRVLNDLFLCPSPEIRYAGHASDASQGFSQLFDAYARRDEFCDITLSASLLRILLSLSFAYKQGSGRRPLARSMTYLNSRYTSDIKISELAEMEGLSISRYNVIFREQNGTSPLKYLINLRINHACTLLSTTDLSVSEIGVAVGYEDNHFFSKVFKKRVGKSPSEFRVDRESKEK